MKRERYNELSRNMKLKLTDEEVADGWHFCYSEWDDMLIHKNWPEAECCNCRFGAGTEKESS